MKISTHSVLMATVAVMSAGVLSIAQTVTPPPPPRPVPSVHLVAYVQPLVPQPHPFTSAGRAALVDAPPPTAAPLAIPIAPNLANTIDNAYLAIEPWVQYGFEVAASVVAWIPFVGWASGLIMDGYFFGESLVASGVFNFTDWLRGNGGVVENLVDFGIDVGLAFVWLGLDALNTFIPLPPCQCYPPRPPVQGPFLAAAEAPTTETQLADASGVDEVQQTDEGLTKKQGGENVAAQESAPGATEVDATTEGATVQDTTVQDTTVQDATVHDTTVQDTTVQDDHEVVDISASAHEDATAESADSAGAATTPSSGTVQAQGEVHESGVAEPVGAAAEGQPAAELSGTQAPDDQTAATQTQTQTAQTQTQTPSTPESSTDSSGTGDNSAGK